MNAFIVYIYNTAVKMNDLYFHAAAMALSSVTLSRIVYIVSLPFNANMADHVLLTQQLH